MKQYQPGRTEFLINTDWGTPKEAIPADEGKKRGLVLFKGRWVTKEEKKRLIDENHAYRSVRIAGWWLVLMAILGVLVGISMISPAAKADEAIAGMVVAVLFSLMSLVLGIGVLKYKNWCRIIAGILFMFAFPLGWIFAYYLLRKTAGRIFEQPKIKEKNNA